MPTPKVRIKRTSTPNAPPTNLTPGELAVEMAEPVRLWVGVPMNLDPTGRKLLLAPTDSGGGIDAYTKTEADAKFVELIGDRMTGSLTIGPTPADMDSLLRLDTSPTDVAAVRWQVGGVTRWSVTVDGATPGGDQGGELRFISSPDAGGSGVEALTINRTAGRLTARDEIVAKVFRPKDSETGGFKCKNGATNTVQPGYYNFNWTGTDFRAYFETTSLGTVAFTSDHRVKKDVVDLIPTWDLVKALRPVSFTFDNWTPHPAPGDVRPEQSPLFVADGKERWGFIAHELQETLIEDAASGVKDAPNELQSPNPWTVLAAVTKALQEAMARIEQLEAAAV